MIESVGYTDDGMVWVNVRVVYNDKPATLKLIMTPENAREARAWIKRALRGIENERVSTNPDKSVTKGD